MHSEYSYLAEIELDRISPDWDKVKDRLIYEHGWTVLGAAALVELVRDYGAFMLGNASALATALGVEDGKLGY